MGPSGVGARAATVHCAPLTCPGSLCWAAGSRRSGPQRPEAASRLPPALGPGPQCPRRPPPLAGPWRASPAAAARKLQSVGERAQKVLPRASCGELCSPLAQAAAAISCHLAAPHYPQGRARGGDSGGCCWGRAAGDSDCPWVPDCHWVPHPPKHTWGPTQGAGTGVRGLRACATWTRPKPLGVVIFKEMRQNLLSSGNY